MKHFQNVFKCVLEENSVSERISSIREHDQGFMLSSIPFRMLELISNWYRGRFCWHFSGTYRNESKLRQTSQTNSGKCEIFWQNTTRVEYPDFTSTISQLMFLLHFFRWEAIILHSADSHLSRLALHVSYYIRPCTQVLLCMLTVCFC